MVKKNKGGKLIILIGVLTITIVTYCAFNREKITYKYYEYTVEKKYSNTNTYLI